MAERQSGGVPTIRGETLAEVRQEMNLWLTHLANQIDQLTGNRGVPTLRANLNMTGKRIESLGAPTAEDHAVPAGYALTRASKHGAYDAGQVGIQNLPTGVSSQDAINLAQLQALRTTDLADFIEAAQDAVGAALTDTATIDLTYTDASNQITADVINNSITDAKLRTSAATSVMGRSANSSGTVADIAASADDQVLRRSGAAVGFGTISTASLSNVTSGTYTPTLTGVANVAASTAYAAQYLRVGSVVTVSGKVDIDPTAPGLTQLGVSLPVASNLAAAEQCGGVACAPGIAGEVAAILADATNDRAEIDWTTVDVSNQSFYFVFTYQVI